MRWSALLVVIPLSACTSTPPVAVGAAAPPASASPPPPSPAVHTDATPSPSPAPLTLFLGTRQSCALADGAFRCWGYNASGQLLLPAASSGACASSYGITLQACVRDPAPIGALQGARAIAFGEEHACSIDAHGGVACWGDDRYLTGSDEGLAACGTGRHCRFAPRAVPGLGGVEEIAAGIELSCARTRQGEVWCWGWNDLGQVGDGTTTGSPCAEASTQHCRTTPTRVAGLAKATQIVAGVRHACALLADGTVSCWGESDSGQLGDGTTGAACGDSFCRASPVAVKGLEHVQRIAAGSVHTCALRQDGSVFCWGDNDGRIGDGTSAGSPCGYKMSSRCRLAPVRVTGIEGAAEIASGAESTCVRMPDGKVRCWGRRLGSKVNDPRALAPEPVAGISDATRLFMGDYHACVITRGDHITCWGSNFFGQLGDGTIQDRTSPVEPKL